MHLHVCTLVNLFFYPFYCICLYFGAQWRSFLYSQLYTWFSFYSYLNKLAEFLKLFVSLHFKRLEAEPEFDAIEFLSYLFQYTFQVHTVLLIMWLFFLNIYFNYLTYCAKNYLLSFFLSIILYGGYIWIYIWFNNKWISIFEINVKKYNFRSPHVLHL